MEYVASIFIVMVHIYYSDILLFSPSSIGDAMFLHVNFFDYFKF
jgi:hypothetical protein